jgi:hypothetical protein
MAQTQLWTFQDAVEDLLDLHEVERNGLNYRHARRAVIEALRQLSSLHHWTIYEQVTTISTVASQTSSTITFDLTGGAYERMVTLASGTWPSWAAFGSLVIDNVVYTVEDRKSDTIITLSANSAPAADVAAGTTYTLYRDTYPLPVNFRELTQVVDTDLDRMLSIVEGGYQHFMRSAVYQSPATPEVATIRGDQEYYGSLSLIFSPPPSSVRYYDVLYTRTPRELKIDKLNAGTVAVTAGSTTVTGTSTAFPEDCVGSIIRFSESSTEPTNTFGVFNGASPVDNRYYAQRVITARASATSLTIDSVVSSSTALSGDAYTISDPIDIEWHSMSGAFRALAEAEFCRLAGRKNWQERWAYAQQMVRYAIEADTRGLSTPQRVPYDPFVRTTHTTVGA